ADPLRDAVLVAGADPHVVLEQVLAVLHLAARDEEVLLAGRVGDAGGEGRLLLVRHPRRAGLVGVGPLLHLVDEGVELVGAELAVLVPQLVGRAGHVLLVALLEGVDGLGRLAVADGAAHLLQALGVDELEVRRVLHVLVELAHGDVAVLVAGAVRVLQELVLPGVRLPPEAEVEILDRLLLGLRRRAGGGRVHLVRRSRVLRGAGGGGGLGVDGVHGQGLRYLRWSSRPTAWTLARMAASAFSFSQYAFGRPADSAPRASALA